MVCVPFSSLSGRVGKYINLVLRTMFVSFQNGMYGEAFLNSHNEIKSNIDNGEESAL